LTPVDAHSGRWGLAPSAASAFQPAAAEDLLVVRVGQPGVGDRGLTAQRGVVRQLPVDLAVDAADEERRDRAQPRQVVAVGLGLLEPGEERVHDRVVALEAEDQGDVDADALREHLRDRRQPCLGRRDLDVEVGTVDEPPQRLGLGHGAVAVVGDPRVDLDRHAAVDAVGAVVDLPHDVAGPAHVVRS
jgi:hypothetical protein